MNQKSFFTVGTFNEDYTYYCFPFISEEPIETGMERC